MSKHHGHKKHHGKNPDKKFEPQVQSPDQKQVDKAAEHEPQAAAPANSGEAVNVLSPGIPKTEANPPKEAKDDEKQEKSEGGSQGEVPDDQDQKLFAAMKELGGALKTFEEKLDGLSHLDEDVKRLIDSGRKIIGKMDADHVDAAGIVPPKPEFTGDLDQKAKDEGKASTADQPLLKDQGKNVNETGSNDGKVNEEGKISEDPLGPAPSTPAKDREETNEVTAESATPAALENEETK